jgi:hypothetical protein
MPKIAGLRPDLQAAYDQATNNAYKYGIAEYTPVPIPGAVWLFGAGLMGLVGIRRRFQK